jgi:hypothetical protein
MKPKKYLGLLRLLFVVGIVSWGMLQGEAQTKATPQSKAKTADQSQAALTAPKNKVWIKDPNSVMPMRQTTNAERRAAAVRNSSRRAAAQRRPNVPANQGVQQ